MPTTHVVVIVEGSPLGPGSTIVDATVPTSACAPSSTAMLIDSSSPPTGAAADAAMKIRPAHSRMLNGGSE